MLENSGDNGKHARGLNRHSILSEVKTGKFYSNFRKCKKYFFNEAVHVTYLSVNNNTLFNFKIFFDTYLGGYLKVWRQSI